MNVKRIAIAAGLPLVASMVIAGGSPAMAKGGGDGHERSGSCSGSTDWKMKAKPDDGMLEVEFEVDSNISGQVWNVKITDNGSKIFKGQETTGGASGSFSVELKTEDLAGKDKFRGRAVNKDTGEVCVGRVSW
jgi:hypothetical protein